MLNFLKISLVALLIVLATIIVGSFATKTCYVVDTNPTGTYEFDIGICRGRLEARSAHVERARSVRLFRVRSGDPILNGVQVQHIGGALGMNLWRNYTSATQIGNGPQVVNPTSYLVAVTVDPLAGTIFCVMLGGYLFHFRKRKSRRGFEPVGMKGRKQTGTCSVENL